MRTVRIDLPAGFYNRDPQQTELGRKILQNSATLILEMGFEGFTFKKLATHIQSTEASIYRYFKNKHLLLLYFYAWHWEWLHYRIDSQTIKSVKPVEKLFMAVKIISNPTANNIATSFINERLLQQIVINEGFKVYHTKLVDSEDKEGLFINLKQLVDKLKIIILEVDDTYEFPRSLATNIIEMSYNQAFFAEHLPGLTDIDLTNNNAMLSLIWPYTKKQLGLA